MVAAAIVGLPALTLSCLGPGPAVGLAALRGRPAVVNLWASWCRPCWREMPVLQAAYRSHGDSVAFVGVATMDRPRSAVGLLADLDVTFPQLFDGDGALLRHLGLQGLPVTLVLDREGRVVNRHLGPISAGQLDSWLEAARRGTAEGPPGAGPPGR